MSFYRHHIFPHVLELATRSRSLHKPRRRTLAGASGRILEIGFGTAANLAFYPPHVTRIEALDPDARLDRYARPRIEASTIEVGFHHLDAEHLPFEAERFDTVVCTLTLCSIPDPAAALREVHRVLVPGGRLLFLEHGLSPDPGVARWQRRLNPLQRAIGGGCNLDRPTSTLLVAAGLQVPDLRQYYLRGAPRFLGYMSEGVALKP
jgi:ubiquinone/menaquinone biosynthesis C-methylase UbiE